MISVIIKGNRFEAGQAATRRNIPMAFVRQTDNETVVGKVGDQFADRVARWYCEDIRAEKGIGFPIGSLLHYSII